MGEVCDMELTNVTLVEEICPPDAVEVDCTDPANFDKAECAPPEPPEGGGETPIGGGGNSNSPTAEDPREAYEVTTNEEAIDLAKKLECFNSVPDNANTVYEAKLCADLPNNNNPNELFSFAKGAPGHAFITLAKTNGENSVMETFGFYPKNGLKSTLGGFVQSQIVNDGISGR